MRLPAWIIAAQTAKSEKLVLHLDNHYGASIQKGDYNQGQRTLTFLSGKDLEQVVVVPTA